MRTFPSVSRTKDWIIDRVACIKSRLDERQNILCVRLQEIGAELDSKGSRELTEELDKLRLFRQQTVSHFGESTQNISVIDSKISDLENRISELELTSSDDVTDKISVTWGEEEINRLISTLGIIALTVKSSDKSPKVTPCPVSPLRPLPPVAPKPSGSPPKKPSRDHVSYVPPVPLSPSKASLSEYVLDSVDSSLEQSDNDYVIPTSGVEGYYTMTPLDTSVVQYEEMAPPSLRYEEIGDLPEEERTRLDREGVSKKYPRHPLFLRCPEGTSEGCIMKPKTICVSPTTGNLYVAEKGNNRVQVLTPNGEHLKFFSDKTVKMSNPYGVCYANDHVYVTQSTLHCVYVFTPGGVFYKKFGKEGGGDGRFSLPSSLAPLPPKQLIYICDTGNNRLQVFDYSNNFVKVLGAGQLLRPVDVSCDTISNIVVLDRSPKCLHVFAQSGDLLYSCVPFSLHKEISNPLFLTLGPGDQMFLSDYARNCVFVFSSDGAMRGQIGGEGVLVEPRGLAFDSRGRLLVLSCNPSGCLHYFDL